jgi:hypothetical protein
VGKLTPHSVRAELFTLRENRMRPQEQWTSSSCVAGEPQVGRRRCARGCHTTVCGHDEPRETRGGASEDAKLGLLKVVSTSEPRAQPCASIETVSFRRHSHGRFDGAEHASVIPPVKTSTHLPAYESIRPISEIELQ